jgi:hypothetical protein
VASGYEMRIGDAEREAAAAELREHFASGRLNQDELDERLSAVFAAKTRADLNAQFTDLPSSGREGAGASTPGSGQRSAPFGPGAPGWGPWTQAGASDDWQPSGNAGRCGSAGSGIGRFVATSVLVWVLFIVGIFAVFGIGAGRPFGIVLLLAALALLRRLLFMIFGRRRGRSSGPRRGGARRRF